MCGIVGYYFFSRRLALIHNGILESYAVLKLFQVRSIHLKKRVTLRCEEA